ncbi:MAG: dTDP-4-amino-4,6-dideoxygalactose transaminase [Bacteroidota bacterium]
MTRTIPFNRASVAGSELAYISEAVGGAHLSGDGTFTRRCNALLENILGAPKVLLTTSCTHALEMAALLLEIAPGDEVIIPSFTFVSTANAFVLRGARPVFVDVRPDTLNLDESRLEALITPKTRAVVPVHYAGVACTMDRILEVSARHGVAVVEDNAHGLFGTYQGKPLGTFGTLATLSFHETKNIVCGEGGALMVNDQTLVERAEIVREKGTDRSRFFRGQVDKYTWVDVGSSYLPSDILAAFLLGQLERRDDIQEARKRIWIAYDERLSTWASRNNVRLPVVPPGCGQPYHLYYMLLPSLAAREGLIAHLRSRGIASAFHYLPLHLSRMGKLFGGKPGDCPVTESVSDRLLRLPMYNTLSGDEQERVIEAVEGFRP